MATSEQRNRTLKLSASGTPPTRGPVLIGLVLLFSSSCLPPIDGEADAGLTAEDAGASDAMDAGPGRDDAGDPDGGERFDAGDEQDAGTLSDGGSRDAGQDAGRQDAGGQDAGRPDGGDDDGGSSPDGGDVQDAGTDGGGSSADAGPSADAGSDAGQVDGGPMCIPLAETVPVIPADAEFLWVVDRSGSMDWPAEGSTITRWQALTSALTTTLPRIDSLPLGLLSFPQVTGGSEVSNCSVSTALDIPVAFGNRPEILSRLIVADPRAGDTPTPSALTTATTSLTSTPSTRERFLVLVTDGLPDANCGATVAAAVSEISALRTNLGVDTFVVGIVGPDNVGSTAHIPALRAGLNLMANAGGRSRAGAVQFYEAGNDVELVREVEAIIGASTDCSFLLETAPSDPEHVGVMLDSASVPATQFTLNGVTLTLQGGACASVMSGDVEHINVTGGCPTN